MTDKNIAEQITWNRLQDKFDPELLDSASFEIEGIDTRDYPDFVDAFISYAEFKDGTPLSEDELDALHGEYNDIVYEAVMESLY